MVMMRMAVCLYLSDSVVSLCTRLEAIRACILRPTIIGNTKPAMAIKHKTIASGLLASVDQLSSEIVNVRRGFTSIWLPGRISSEA